MDSKTGNLDRYLPRVLLQRLASDPTAPVQTLDGSMVFVDISGFTRLSERLARFGKEGSEHLTDTINSCFSELLADAYAHGGSLLKFGGDALLLWFEGAGHPTRACSAAVAMRRTLRSVGRIRAGSGSIVLRMSVGVHSGAYEQFLVGGSHREHVIAGPAASEVVAMEAAASAGQILLSPATAALLPDRCLGERLGPGVLLVRAPTSPTPGPMQLTDHPTDAVLADCLSTEVRAHALTGSALPEHRAATIARSVRRDRRADQRGGAGGGGAGARRARADRAGGGRPLRRLPARLRCGRRRQAAALSGGRRGGWATTRSGCCWRYVR